MLKDVGFNELSQDVPEAGVEGDEQNRKLLAELGDTALDPLATHEVETPVNGLGYQYKEKILAYNKL